MLRGCREYRKPLIDLARGRLDNAAERRALHDHTVECPQCARVLDEQLALSAAMHGISQVSLGQPLEIEAAVLAEFDAVNGRSLGRVAPIREGRRATRWLLVAGLAAAVCLAVVLTRPPRPAERPDRNPAQVAEKVTKQAPESPVVAALTPAAAVKRTRGEAKGRAKGTPQTDPVQPFLTIPYTVPLSAQEQASVVRMDIPVAALIAAGYQLQVSDPTAVMHADVLVSQDGRARAIRPLSISILE